MTGATARAQATGVGARADGQVVGDVVGAACEGLGAWVRTHVREARAQESAMDAVVASTCATQALDVLVVDGASLFAAGGLHECLEGAWDATRAVAGGAFIPSGDGGRIVYLAPASGADRSEIVQRADAARAGLENLARTLSVEWARYAITTVAIALGDRTEPDEAAALAAYLASPAGEYFSGCQLDLRGI